MAAMAVLGLMSLGTVQAGNVSGRVVSLSDAKGVPNAMVTLEFAEGSPGAAAVTVFSSDDRHFSVSGNDQQSLKGANIRVSKPGFRVADDMALALSGKEPELSIVLKPTDNIADAVPASAWFEQTPAGDERNITLTSCSSCHQMASPRVRRADRSGQQRSRR